MTTSLEVIHGDVLGADCDILVLKYAQKFRGADLVVARALGLDSHGFALEAGEHRLLPADGRLACQNVLFYGVGGLNSFGYEEIRAFSANVLETLAVMDMREGTMAMTMHGAGYGLDEREAFTAQIAGLLDYLTAASDARAPQRVIIVEQNLARCQRMQAILQKILSDSGFGRTRLPTVGPRARLPDAGIRSDAKKHVFVAMPFLDEMEDTYEFGIKDPVNDSGYLCERCDQDIFTGDILDRIKGRITTASVVIADLTGSNPNVYLEVGYAWGKGVPTLLIAREGEDLKFDVKTQKCLFYKSISHLRKQLVEYMLKLRNAA